MLKIFKPFVGLLMVLFLFTACNDADDTLRETGNDIRNVSFGPGTGTNDMLEHNTGRNTPAYPFGTGDRAENNDGSLFPYQKDRGFEYDKQYDFDGDEHLDRRNNDNNQFNRTNNRTVQNNTNNQQTQNNNVNNRANSTQNASEFVQEVIRLTNEERRKSGLPDLKMDAELNKVAQIKAEDMAAQGYFSHQSPTYGSPFDMLKQFNVDYSVAAENIAAGQTSPENVVQVWMNSEGHRANILNKRVTHIGVGYEEGGSMRTYWSQMFIAK
ncbi:CAP domain-containing protein [Bacillaceae bacterium W0354]